MFFEVLTWAIFPLLINTSNNILPPLFFAGTSLIIAGLFLLFFVILRGKIKDFINKKALPYMLSATFFIVLVVFPLIFIAGQKTSPGNMSILGQSEVLFTFLFFGLLGFEKITKNRIIGAILVLTGVLLILLKNFSGLFNVWDWIIVLACCFAPFGNFFQQKAIKLISSVSHVCFRNLIGGIILITASLFTEKINIHTTFSQNNIFLILTNGIVAFGLSKILFMEAIKRIDVSKALVLGASYPAFSIFLAFIFLQEIPTIEQIVGFIIIFIGVYFTTQNHEKWWNFTRKKTSRRKLV